MGRGKERRVHFSHVVLCHLCYATILLLLWEYSKLLIPCVCSSYEHMINPCIIKRNFFSMPVFAQVLAKKQPTTCSYKIHINPQFELVSDIDPHYMHTVGQIQGLLHYL